MKLKKTIWLVALCLAAGTLAAQSGKQAVNNLAVGNKKTKTVKPAASGPGKQRLEVLYLSMDKTLIVTFRNNRQNIVSVDVGSNSIGAEIINNQTAVRLMALKKGFKETNLTIFSNGRYYGYLLRYIAVQNEIVHYLDAAESLEKDMESKEPAPVKNAVAALYKETKTAAGKTAANHEAARAARVYDSMCTIILQKGIDHNPKYTSTNGSCAMLLDQCYVYNDKLYFVLRFSNTSSITYDIDFIKFGTTFIKKPKNQAEQESELTPVFEYFSSDNSIPSGNFLIKIFVFDKFTIDKKTKQLKVESWEKNGERVLTVLYPSKNIINAVQL
jgi:Domain of unknown function (DUF4138)